MEVCHAKRHFNIKANTNMGENIRESYAPHNIQDRNLYRHVRRDLRPDDVSIAQIK